MWFHWLVQLQVGQPNIMITVYPQTMDNIAITTSLIVMLSFQIHLIQLLHKLHSAVTASETLDFILNYIILSQY